MNWWSLKGWWKHTTWWTFPCGKSMIQTKHYQTLGKSHKSVTLNVVPVDRQRGEVLGRFNLAATSSIPRTWGENPAQCLLKPPPQWKHIPCNKTKQNNGKWMNMGQFHEFPLNMMTWFHSQWDSYIFWGNDFLVFVNFQILYRKNRNTNMIFLDLLRILGKSKTYSPKWWLVVWWFAMVHSVNNSPTKSQKATWHTILVPHVWPVIPPDDSPVIMASQPAPRQPTPIRNMRPE